MMGQDQEIYQLFRSEIEKQVKKAKDTIWALAAADERALSQLKMAIHSIKSAARIVSMASLELLCHSIEDCLLAIERHHVTIQPKVIDLLLQSIDVVHMCGTKNDSFDASYIAIMQKRLEACILHKVVDEKCVIKKPADDKSSWLHIDPQKMKRIVGHAREILHEAEALHKTASPLALENHRATCDTLYRLVQEAQLISFSSLTDCLPSYIQEMANGKSIQVIALGEDVKIDKEIFDHIKMPILQLLRNAVDHGIEPEEERTQLGKNKQGMIVVEAKIQDNSLMISVADDGRGIDSEGIKQKISEQRRTIHTCEKNLALVAEVSTKERATTTSGRGIALSHARQQVQALGGTIMIDSAPQIGSLFQLKLPLSLAALSVLLVAIGDELYGIPSAHIHCVDRVEPTAYSKKGVLTNGIHIPLLDTRIAMGVASPATKKEHCIVVVEGDNSRYAFEVDDFFTPQEVILQGNTALLKKAAGFMGCAINRENQPILVISVQEIIDLYYSEKEF